MIYKENQNYFFNDSGFEFIISNNLLLDGKMGGIILGNSHKDGGVKVVGLTTEKRLFISCEVEGFEFFMNCDASKKHINRLKEINSDLDEKIDIVDNLSKVISLPVLDARPVLVDGIQTSKLIGMECDEHFVINKYSTAKYINELIMINQK